MRKKASGLVTVRAISGTHVVFLALNMKESDAKGLMGLAIQRTDLTEEETIWLRGNKTFASATSKDRGSPSPCPLPKRGEGELAGSGR